MSSSSLKRSVVRIGGVVVPIAIAAFLVLQQANFLVGRSLLIAFGDNESTYRSAWFEWDGDIVARDVVIDPYGLGAEAAIRFERVHVETPGWFWFVRNTFDRKLKRARLDRIHLTLTSGESLAGFEPSLGDLGPFGAASASPFEAEGCSADNLWLRDELVAMGLQPGPTTLEFDYRVDGTKVDTTITLDTPGASKVTLIRRERLERPVNALLLDYAPTETDYEQWTIVDDGFVQARNRFCAERDGIDAAAFVQRHVQSVQRLLQIAGIAADPATLSAYRAFASSGGTLTFGGTYTRPLHSDEFYDARDSGEALLRMDAVLERNGRRTAVQWQQFDPRPLAGFDDGEPTWAALQRERAQEQGGIAPADAASPAIEPDASASAPPVADAAATAAASTPQPPAPATPAPAAQPAPVAPTAAAAPPDAQSVAAAPATTAPKITRAVPAAWVAPSRDVELGWNELDDHADAPIRIWTALGPPRIVTVLEATPGQVRVRAELGGGYADYTILRESFKRAVLVR